MNSFVKFRFYLEEVERLGLVKTNVVLIASIPQQRMYLYNHDQTVKTYVISTSKLPPSCIENSLGTPWGLHKVEEIIGEGSPLGTIFRARKDTGVVYWEVSAEDNVSNLITTRILRLKGLEKGVNLEGEVDSFSRFIYIHGTNHENRLGEPSSSGCIQVSNADAMELAAQIPQGSHIYIDRAD